LQRLAWKQRKEKQRANDKAAQDLYARTKNRTQFWADNRAKLSPEELQELERRQAEFLGYFAIVNELIEKLNTGAAIGEPSGLPYPDIASQETKEYIQRTSGTRLVFHPSEEEFANLHHPDSNPKILETFRDADPDYFMYGYFTLFSHACWIQFLNTLAEFIGRHPNHPDIDPAIAAQILIEARGHVPVPVVVPPQPEPISEAERQIHERLNAGFTTPPPFSWEL
jgi:hypothetical protein